MAWAAQQLVAPDLAIEIPCEVSFAFAAFQVKFRSTAKAARRVNSGPLAGLKPESEYLDSLCGLGLGRYGDDFHQESVQT